jgi:hypothetical protein|nr:MAG TPA: hypothetical protein [Caudoviricetes sp.]
MKISELTQITAIRRDIKLPLSVAGQNMSISLGQIIDAISQDVVPFSGITPQRSNVQYTAGTSSGNIGSVVFDSMTNKFYCAIGMKAPAAGHIVINWTYYSDWATHDSFYTESGAIRTDCLFLASDGRLYRYNGTTLKSAGITEDQAKQIRLSTPIEVASEEEMEQRIAAGEYEAGQLYYLAEEE